MEAIRGRSRFLAALGAALSSPDLRRLQLGWTVSAVGGWVVFVALAVYAYNVGGAVAVGAAALVRMVPAGLAAPFLGVLADRHSRRDVLLASCLARALIVVGIALAALLSAPFAVVLALAALFTVVAAAHKPAQAALLPSLALNPRQLGASNAVSSALDNAAFLAGGLLSGVLIVAVGVDRVFLVTGALFAFAALALARIRRDPVPLHRVSDDGLRPVRDAVDGVRVALSTPRLRLIVGLVSLSTLVEGAVDVLVVLLAIHVLGLGGSGVGWLNACWGAGGIAGGALAIHELGRGRLASGLASGSLLVGLALMLIGAVASVAVAAAMLILVGVGYALIEIAGISLLQRLATSDVLARVFGVLESSYWITTGVGAMLAPALVGVLGVRGAFVFVGVSLPLCVLARWAALSRFEAGAIVPERPFNRLRQISLFEPLSLATVENVSRMVDALEVPAGATVVREGETGDRFYVVERGVLDVSCVGGRFPPVSAGDFFGEIALLQDIPRTATVTARDDCLLYALDRESFLAAVSSHGFAARAAGSAASERLAQVPEQSLAG